MRLMWHQGGCFKTGSIILKSFNGRAFASLMGAKSDVYYFPIMTGLCVISWPTEVDFNGIQLYSLILKQSTTRPIC